MPIFIFFWLHLAGNRTRAYTVFSSRRSSRSKTDGENIFDLSRRQKKLRFNFLFLLNVNCIESVANNYPILIFFLYSVNACGWFFASMYRSAMNASATTLSISSNQDRNLSFNGVTFTNNEFCYQVRAISYLSVVSRLTFYIYIFL